MLKPPEGKEYEVSVTQAKPWRMLVTLTEYELVKRKRVPTGRAWTEPFDPVKGDEVELEARFARQIAGPGATDIPQTPTEVLADHLGDCFCLESLDIPPRFLARALQLIKRVRSYRRRKANA